MKEAQVAFLIAALLIFAACGTTPEGIPVSRVPPPSEAKPESQPKSNPESPAETDSETTAETTEEAQTSPPLTVATLADQESEIKEALVDAEAASLGREGELLAITLKGDVTFAPGAVTVKPKLTDEIRKIARVLARYPRSRVSVEGHSDSQGDETYNLKLSRKRAEAVKDLLVKFGVAEHRIKVEAFGESQPIATNNTEEGRRRNRRVEIKVLSTGS
jgi:outer membrane protein OmpA-like peptidoglycan-associated protein